MIHILFILRDYEHGGIPRVLANLLERIDPSRIDVDLFVCNPCGIFLGKMPNCRILPLNIWLQFFSCNYRKQRGFFRISAIFLKIIRHACIRFFHRDILLYWAEKRVAKSFGNRYDVIWACSEDIPARLAEYTSGYGRKIIWIHNNYDVLYPEVEAGGLPDFMCYNKIVCVAKFAVDSLVRVLKERKRLDLTNSAICLYNILNDNEIRELGGVKPNDSLFRTDVFTIVSVGRLAYQKQFDAVPSIAARIKEMGGVFHWYIIGDGAPAMWQWIRGEIQKYEVEQEVLLLGVRSNPYAYIASADLLVVPSRYETYSTVINEAKALGTPVIANNFTGIEEILFPENGCFCPLEQLPEKIYEATQRGRISYTERKKKQIDFSSHNNTVMTEFYRIIEEN